MLTPTDIDFLTRSLTFWDNLKPIEQQLILDYTMPLTYKQDTTIHGGNRDCIGVLLVKSGTLRTYLLSDEGKEVTLYRLSSGDICILSASCLLKNITFDVHIDAEVDTQILLIDSSIFARITSQNIYVENFSYKVAAEKFSDVIWAMEQILFMSFDKRLAIFLIDEATKNNSNTIYLTHEQIAKYMGSAREVVSRMLKYFANEGWVQLSRGSITLMNKKCLRALM